MDNDIGLSRHISIMLILNALTGFLYSILPNTYIVKEDAYALMLAGMAALAALLSYLAWRYGKAHSGRHNPYQPAQAPQSAWEQTFNWLLPLFFIPLFALVGTRAVIVFWAYHGETRYSEAVLSAHAPPNAGNWWTLDFAAPFERDITLAVPPDLLAQFRQGDKLRLQYRETPLAFAFTGMNRYWQVEKLSDR